MVQRALSRITQPGASAKEQLAQETAAVLADALGDGQAPLAVVVAALLTAIMDCVVPSDAVQMTTEQYSAALDARPQQSDCCTEGVLLPRLGCC